jgi:replicative DNA helicase
VKEERLSGALQENILTLLCFNDAACKLIRSAVTPQLFESSVFREVAGHAIDFIDQFGEAIKEHLADSLEHILTGDDTRKASSYKKLVDNLFAAKDSVNADYTLSQLNKFVRQQVLKSAIVRAVEAIEDGRIDAAEVEIQKGLKAQVVSFDRGLNLSDAGSALSFMDTTEHPLLTGIDELDRRHIGVRKKEQLMVMAPAGMGKTWFLCHLGKWALLQRQCVVHLTLEMPETQLAQRYVQAFFAVSKHDAEIRLPTLVKNRDGSLDDVLYEQVRRVSFEDPGIRAKLESRVRREFRRRPPLIIKEFPTGVLTLPQLEAYLDGLERFHKITPDVLIIDYPDLMDIDMANMRTSLGSLTKKLRGLASERNLALIIASQSNRESVRAKMVDGTHAAEDFSKIGTADTVLTYTQTPAEKKLGLARIFVEKSRSEEGRFVSLITQAYAIGQFALDSCSMGDADYFSFLAGNRHDDNGS